MSINKDNESLPLLTWQQLNTINFSFNSRFKLPLQNGEFVAEKILRIIPKKRIVVLGHWQGKQVVAKLFFDSHAMKKLDKEATGVKLLLDHRIPTPALYYQGMSEDRRISVLLFEYLRDAQSLEDWC